MKSAVLVVILASAPLAFAAPAVTELSATGEHRLVSGETPDAAHRLALADAHRNIWRTAVTGLQSHADIKALQLKTAQLEAYTAALLETTVEPARTPGATTTVERVTLRATMSAEDLAKRMAAIRKDQDATFDLLAAWADLQAIQDGRAFATRLLTARASVAAARIEPATIGGRAASPEGKRRAKSLLDEALALSPDSASARYALGYLLIDGQQAVEAETEFRKGLNLQPGSSEGHRGLAETLRLQSKIDEAAAELREALRLEPASARAHNDFGTVLESQRNVPDAMAEYREAIRLDADLIDAHNNLAISFARQGRMPDAIVEFREMIRIDPDSATAYYNLATALADMDQDTESAAALREVIRINPNHYNAHYNLGELFRLEGKYDESAKQFREFLRLAPGDTPAGRRNIERAKSLVEKFENPQTP